jgi:hypothetical protein
MRSGKWLEKRGKAARAMAGLRSRMLGKFGTSVKGWQNLNKLCIL